MNSGCFYQRHSLRWRQCRAVELDPVYCDVIVKRYINQVGTAADVKLHRGDEIIDYTDL